jgi:hypothetical protein
MQIFYSPAAIPIVAIISVFVWLTISAIAETVQKIVKSRDEIQLKQTLADRGLSAEEIERIVVASSSDEDSAM